MISLTKEQIIMIHQALIEATGGSQGVRDEGMLELVFIIRKRNYQISFWQLLPENVIMKSFYSG